MSSGPAGIFRQRALDAQDLEEHDGAMVRLIEPRDALGLAVLAFLLAAVLMWTVFGQVRMSVSGVGILLDARTVTVADGELVEGRHSAGSVLALLSEPERALRAAQARAARDAARDQTEASLSLLEEERTLQRQVREVELAKLEARVVALDLEIGQLRSASSRALQRRRTALQSQVTQAGALVSARAEALASAERLVEAGAVSRAGLADAREAHLTALTQAADFQSQLDSVEVEASETRLRLESLGRELDALLDRRATLEVASLAYRREVLGTGADLEESLRTKENELDRLDLALARARLDAESSEEAVDSGLWVLLLIDAADGKKVRPGMEVRVALDHIERARFGSLVGEVREVANRPLSASQVEALVTVPELASDLAQQGHQLAVVATLTTDERAPSGYLWTSRPGPELELTPGSTLVGRVTVERRAPVTWLLPLLRTWTGTEGW